MPTRSTSSDPTPTPSSTAPTPAAPNPAALTGALLTEKEAARYLTISVYTLRRMRSDNSGPPPVQLSERRIAYRRAALDQWIAAHERSEDVREDRGAGA